MLLLGPLGVGKTHFARQVAQLLGTGMGLVPMSSLYSLLEYDTARAFTDEFAEVLACLADLAPREMRRAWMTAFGNARLERRCTLEVRDLPPSVGGHGRRAPMGFMQ